MIRVQVDVKKGSCSRFVVMSCVLCSRIETIKPGPHYSIEEIVHSSEWKESFLSGIWICSDCVKEIQTDLRKRIGLDKETYG